MQVLDRTGVGTLWSICKTKFALVGHTHNVIQDAGDGSNITFAYSEPGLNYNDFTWLAGWNGRQLRAVNKSLFAAASHTHTLGQITNAGAAASKNVRTLNSVSHSSWSSASTDDLYVPTMSFIAYWNGAYNSSGNSNLQYCYKGKFGNLAVKDTADWSQVASKPATATRWPSWGEVTGKPELKSWSETKSYIDSKIDSENNYPCYSLQSYIQSQLKPFGLTCRTYPCRGQAYNVGAKCGILIYNNNSLVDNLFGNNSLIQPGTLYNATDVKICKEITYLYRKTIYCIWNNYIISVEYTGSQGSGYSLNVCFYNTLTDTTKKITVLTYSYDTEAVNIHAVACTYDNLYVANDRSLYVFDKSLNFKRYANVIPNQAGVIKYLYNYGDLGIFIKSSYGDNAYYYKNGTISKYTGSASNIGSLKYTKNGHEYDLRSNNYQLITDDLAIKSVVNDTYIAGNTIKKLLFFIVDLQKNIEFQINIPEELFGISMVGNSEYAFNGVPIVEMTRSYYNDDTLRYYVLVYKE